MHADAYPPLGLVIAADILMDVRLDGSTLRWIDLDLDVEVHEDGHPELVDEDEFADHQLRYAYPPEVIAAAEASARIALDLATAAAFPFDRDRQFKDARRLAGHSRSPAPDR